MRRPRTATPAVSALLALGLLGLAGPSYSAVDPADRKREVDKSIESLEEALEGTAAELSAAYRSLEATKARLAQAQVELAAAESVRADAERKDVALAGRLAAAQETERVARTQIADGTKRIDGTEAAIGQIASRAYRGAGLAPEVAIVLDATSPEDFADSYMLVHTAMRSQNSALSRLNEQQAVRANAQARLVAVGEEVARLRVEAAANLKVAEQARVQAETVQAEITTLVAAEAKATAEIESRRAAEEQRLDALEAERSSLKAELARLAEQARARERAAREQAERDAAERQSTDRAGRSRPDPEPRGDSSSGGPLLKPVNAPITSSYGYRIHPIYGTRRLHGGTDFGASCGTPVRAAESGSVVRSGAAGGFGNQVVVDHGSVNGVGLASSYNHLSSIAVGSGSVSRGQTIGYVGTTGTSTGCHLHFEVYVNGSNTDPMGWL